MLTASPDSVALSADLASGGFVHGRVSVEVYEYGRAVVPVRSLATVLSGVAASPSVALRVEGTRLAVRTPTARFALPVLPSAPVEPPDVPVLGIASGLRDAAAVVAGAASKDGLPLFTGVRLRSSSASLTLAATDRFRAAFASVAWESSSSDCVDALVPAPVLAAAARFASPRSAVRSGGDWFGLDWDDGGLVVPGLALPFPDAQLDALAATSPVCVVDVEVESLRGAVDRVAPFAGDGVWVEVADGLLVVRASGVLGDAREEVKASTVGDLCTQRFQPGYLVDAVRALAGERVRIEMQAGVRPTLFSSGELRYLVVPLRST